MTIYDGSPTPGPVPPISELIAHDAQALLAPAMFLLGAVFLWLALRLVLRRDPGRIRRLLGLWLDAKERELQRRAGREGPG
jgi:hypothetical protein